MIAILAASVVGSWTYAGFLAEPTPAPAPAPPSPPPASAPTVPAPAEVKKPAEPPRQESPSLPPATMSSAAPAPAAPRATLYRSTDASGQAWEHPDAASLSSFIEARNRSFAAYSLAPPSTYSYASPRYFRQSPCSGGRCN